MSVPSRSHRLAILYSIFFVSGFCGLIYESIWSHYLKLLLGHAAYAQAVVLVVFVGGMALGAWFTGRMSERLARPILVYAAVEAAVALFAFAFQWLFEAVSAWALDSYLPAVCGSGGACLASWLPAAAIILPPSILLGMTFPLMSAGVMRLGVKPGFGLALLYFLNSAGAALGVLVSGFFLIGAVGLPGTILLAGSMNALVAFAAYAADRLRREPAAPASHAAAPAQGERSMRELRLMLFVAAATGLSSFIYEVAWIRMLTLVLGAATHSFELMLAPFILGLALGAWWIRHRIENSRDTLRLLARIQVFMGLLAVATLPLYSWCFELMAFALRALARTDESYLLFNVASGLFAAAVMLPATICAGMTLPLITAILLRGGHGERQVGQVYGANTFGAIAGVLLAVWVLIPLAGLQWSLATGAAFDVVLGLVLWGFASQREVPTHMMRVALAGVAALAAVFAVPALTHLDAETLASGVFRHGLARLDESTKKVIFHRDGRTATITVIETNAGERAVMTNGKSDGSSQPTKPIATSDDHTMVLLGALGPLHHPGAKKAAVIGLGTGSSSSVLLESPQLEQLETIEIEPTMVEAAGFFRPKNAKVFDDPRSTIVIDDARAHFAKTRARYDIVVSEPSNPWVSGVSGLFTTEFYRGVSAHLAPDGHFVQWLHLYEASPELVASIVRAFSGVFPEFKAYATNDADVVLVARNDGKPPVLAPGALERMPGIQRRLRDIGIESAAVLEAHETGRGDAIKVLAASWGAPPNSDFFPYVDQRAAADRFRNRTALYLFGLRNAPVPIFDFKSGAPESASQVRTATRLMPQQVRNRAGSWHGLRYLRGERLTSEEMSLYLGSVAADYVLLRGWAQTCAFPPDTTFPWNALVHVATDLNPGLASADARGYWQALAARCGKSMTPVQLAWIRLFEAVGARDAITTRTLAARVLELDDHLQPETRAYATLAAVSAGLALGERREAAELFEAQRRKLPEAQMELPWFRYYVMLMTVKERPRTPASP